MASPSTSNRSRKTRESAQSVTWAGTLRPRFWGFTSTWINTSWRGMAKEAVDTSLKRTPTARTRSTSLNAASAVRVPCLP